MKFLFFLPTLLLPLASNGATTVSGDWTVNTTIPDYDDPGYSNIHNFANTGISEIQSITVELSFSGGWNGDLYVYLVHDGALSVLLNRVGRSLADPDGASSSGMTITLTDFAPTDIHTAIPFSGTPTGTFQPDGRITDPYDTLDTDARPAMLSVFNGQSADGNWTLFVADQAPGDQSTLTSWSLSITGVPEPSAALLGVFGGLILLRRRRDLSSSIQNQQSSIVIHQSFHHYFNVPCLSVGCSIFTFLNPHERPPNVTV